MDTFRKKIKGPLGNKTPHGLNCQKVGGGGGGEQYSMVIQFQHIILLLSYSANMNQAKTPISSIPRLDKNQSLISPNGQPTLQLYLQCLRLFELAQGPVNVQMSHENFLPYYSSLSDKWPVKSALPKVISTSTTWEHSHHEPHLPHNQCYFRMLSRHVLEDVGIESLPQEVSWLGQ